MMQFLQKHHKTILWLVIPLISLAMHYRVFDLDLISFHSWRQTMTQINITNFVEEDFNILNPRINERGDGDGIHRMEFPIMQWLFALFYKIFGDHVIISRILTFVIGLFSVFGVYAMIDAIFRNNAMAVVGAWAFNFSPAFYYYTMNPQPDNFALCCSTWGMAFFFRWMRHSNGHALWLSGMFLALGALAKLPFVLFYGAVFTYFALDFFTGQGPKPRIKALPVYGLSLLPVMAWYAWVIPGWSGNELASGIFADHDSISWERLYHLLHHNVISTFPELLINYASLPFFFACLFLIVRNKLYLHRHFPLYATWGAGLIFYFLYEINLIGFIHDYYLLPFLPVIFLMVAYGAFHLITSQFRWARTLCLALLCLLPLTAYLRMEHRWDPEKPGFNKDLIVFKDELRSAVPDQALCVAGNDESGNIFFYYIHKKGWNFREDQLAAGELKKLIRSGAQYLYSDSRAIDENPEIGKMLDELVHEKGSIRVFTLKKASELSWENP